MSTLAAVLSIPNIAYDVRHLNVHTSDSYVKVNSTSAAFFKEDTWVGGLEYQPIQNQVASEIWEKFENTPMYIEIVYAHLVMLKLSLSPAQILQTLYHSNVTDEKLQICIYVYESIAFL